jgi:hypothetical protein
MGEKEDIEVNNVPEYTLLFCRPHLFLDGMERNSHHIPWNVKTQSALLFRLSLRM